MRGENRTYQTAAAQKLETIEQEINRYCNESARHIPPELHQAMCYSLRLPGKRLRPLLVLSSAELAGKPLTKNSLVAACAVEMVHTYSLIHDDLPCIDNDDLRRGQPTNHKVFGEATALLAGSSLYAEAISYLLERVKPLALASRCVRELVSQSGPQGLIGGEFIDTKGFQTTPTIEELEQLNYLKTGRLMEASIMLGAYTGNVSSRHWLKLRQAGRLLGLMFQLTDDLLDRYGEEKKVGKKINKDVEQGKLNFATLYSYQQCQEMMSSQLTSLQKLLSTFSNRSEELLLLARFIAKRDH